MGEKRSKTGIISVEKPTWFPLEDETGNFPVYGTALPMGTAVSIKPTANYETTQDYGDSVAQDQFTAFGGAEVELEANGYTHKVLSTITGGKLLKVVPCVLEKILRKMVRLHIDVKNRMGNTVIRSFIKDSLL